MSQQYSNPVPVPMRSLEPFHSHFSHPHPHPCSLLYYSHSRILFSLSLSLLFSPPPPSNIHSFFARPPTLISRSPTPAISYMPRRFLIFLFFQPSWPRSYGHGRGYIPPLSLSLPLPLGIYLCCCRCLFGLCQMMIYVHYPNFFFSPPPSLAGAENEINYRLCLIHAKYPSFLLIHCASMHHGYKSTPPPPLPHATHMHHIPSDSRYSSQRAQWL